MFILESPWIGGQVNILFQIGNICGRECHLGVYGLHGRTNIPEKEAGGILCG